MAGGLGSRGACRRRPPAAGHPSAPASRRRPARRGSCGRCRGAGPRRAPVFERVSEHRLLRVVVVTRSAKWRSFHVSECRGWWAVSTTNSHNPMPPTPWRKGQSPIRDCGPPSAVDTGVVEHNRAMSGRVSATGAQLHTMSSALRTLLRNDDPDVSVGQLVRRIAWPLAVVTVVSVVVRGLHGDITNDFKPVHAAVVAFLHHRRVYDEIRAHPPQGRLPEQRVPQNQPRAAPNREGPGILKLS